MMALVRCAKAAGLKQLEKIAEDCANGAALMTGCTAEIQAYGDMAYYDLKPNPSGAAVFEDVFSELGLETEKNRGYWAASDVGNVSYVCPAFQPTLKMTPAGTPLHTKEMEEACVSEVGHEDIKIGARIIGRWIAKVFSDPETLAAIKKDFEA